MDKLSKIEKQYIQEMLEGKLDNFNKFRVVIRAFKEGRFKYDLADPKIKAWDKKYGDYMANLLVNIIQGKKEQNIPLTKKQERILENYNRDGTLPPV